MTGSYCYLVVDAHTYTVSRGAAERADMPRGPGQIKSALSGVLAEPGYAERLSHMGQTSGRAEALDRIVDAGWLGADDAAALFPDRRITDKAWAILRRFDPQSDPNAASAAYPLSRQVRSWSLRIIGSGDPTSVDIDPLAFPGSSLPMAAIVAALDDLSSHGWKIVHVSEDRGIDDAASRSHVVAQRILLARNG